MNESSSNLNSMLPSGKWAGFYLESHRVQRGWMHMYMEFEQDSASTTGKIRGEGTDYVGPWTLTGQFDLTTDRCSWTKTYVGQHDVVYQGCVSNDGIRGHWTIAGGLLNGEFHIWPEFRSDLHEAYLQADLELEKSFPLGTVPIPSKRDAI